MAIHVGLYFNHDLDELPGTCEVQFCALLADPETLTPCQMQLRCLKNGKAERGKAIVIKILKIATLHPEDGSYIEVPRL